MQSWAGGLPVRAGNRYAPPEMNRPLACFVVVLSFTAFAQAPRHQRPPSRVVVLPEEQKEIQHGRLDYPGTNVTGQFNSSGAVSIVERKDIPMRSMTVTPKNFRSEILNSD